MDTNVSLQFVRLLMAMSHEQHQVRYFRNVMLPMTAMLTPMLVEVH